LPNDLDITPARPLESDSEITPARPLQAAAGAGAEEITPARPLQPAADAASIQPAVPTSRPALTPEEQRLRETNTVTPAEIEAIAAKHPGANVDTLKSVAPYLGAFTGETELERAGEFPKRLAGMVGRGLFGLPQKYAEHLQDEPTRAAWDELKELAESRHTGFGKVMEIAGEIVTTGGALGAVSKAYEGLTGAAKAAAVLGEGAAMGAAGHVGNARSGEETSGIGLPVAIGMLGMGAFHGLASRIASSGAAREAVQQAAEELAPQLEQVLKSPEMAAETQKGLAVLDHITSEAAGPLAPEQRQLASSFAKWLESPGRRPQDILEPRNETVEKAAGTIRDWAAGKGGGALEKEFAHFRAAQEADALMADAVARGQTGVKTSWYSRIVRSSFRSSAQFGLIDDRMYEQTAGRVVTKLQPLIDQVAQRGNAAARDVFTTLKAHEPELGALKEAGAVKLDLAAVKDLEEGGTAGLKPDQLKALDGWSKRMEQARQYINGLASKSGLTKAGEDLIGKSDASRYIPRMDVDAAEALATVQRTARQVERQAGVRLLDAGSTITDEAMQAARAKSPEAFTELRQQLRYLGGEGFPETSQDLERLLRQTTNPDGINRLAAARTASRTAGANLERGALGAEIPESLRETDLAKLHVRWLDQMMQHVYTGQTLRDIVAQRALLVSAGDAAGVEYLDTWLSTVNGAGEVPRWMAAKRTKAVAMLTSRAEQAEQAGQTGAAAVYRTLATNTDIPSVMMASIYPNLMGGKLSSILKPLLAPFLATMPEMASGGQAWAGAKLVGGFYRTAEQLVTNPAAAYRMLKERGFMPQHMTAESRDAWRNSFQHGVLGTAARRGVEAWSTVMMAGVQMGEAVNRLVAINSARGIAQELLQGGTEAHKFVEAVGRGYQADIRALVAKGDAAGLQAKVEEYLVGKTLQHYSPYHMNELGRRFGRVAGALSTWPSAVAGDIVRDYARRGALGGSASLARKHLAPMAALMGVQHVLNVGGWNPETSPRAEAVVGKQGLAGAAPLHELRPSLGPYAQDAGEVLKQAASMNPAAWWKAANLVGEHYTPILPSMVHFLELLQRAGGRQVDTKGRTITGRGLDLVKPGAGASLDEYVKQRYGTGGKP
jgi:hypothetical protein